MVAYNPASATDEQMNDFPHELNQAINSWQVRYVF